MAHKYSASDYVFQFITIMAGVLIAMLANGMVERSKDRQLVATARTMLAREITDNLGALETLPADVAKNAAEVENALQLANDLLKKGKTEIRSVSFNFNLPTLNESSWQTAERTGALAHMDYDEVKAYSEVYAQQDLFTTHQRKSIDLVAAGSVLIAPSFDPTTAERQDLVRFRESAMQLQANLLVTEQLGRQLSESYQKLLKR